MFEREFSDAIDAENIKTIENAGVEVTRLTPEQVDAFKAAVAPVYEKYRGQYGESIMKIQEAVKNVK